MFPTNKNFDQYMTLIQFFSCHQTAMVLEPFGFTSHYFVVGPYGHIPVEEIYTFQIKAMIDSFPILAMKARYVQTQTIQSPLYPFPTCIPAPVGRTYEFQLIFIHYAGETYKSLKIDNPSYGSQRQLKPALTGLNTAAELLEGLDSTEVSSTDHLGLMDNKPT